MNKKVKEIIGSLKDSAENPVFGKRIDGEGIENFVCLTPTESGLLLDYINQLEQHIRDINQMVKDNCWYPDVGYANMTSNEVMELVQLLNKINVGNKLYWDDDLQNLYNELTKERK